MRVVSTYMIACSVMLAAQGQEFARLLRNDDQATLSVFGSRPVDLAAKKLAADFGVAVNVEDPIYRYKDDMQEIGLARSDRHAVIPRAAFLEINLDLRRDGSLLDIRKAVQNLRDTANAQLPFAYRLDGDSDTFSLVATRTRDERGQPIAFTPILDHRVTIQFAARTFSDHVHLLMQALQAQTGINVACCTAMAPSQPGPLISFGAENEPARIAFLRLVRRRSAR